MSKIAKMMISVVCVATLMCASPAIALAANTLTRTYTYVSQTEDAAQVLGQVEQDGTTFELVGTKVDSRVLEREVHVGHTETVQCWPADLTATKASFANEMEATEDGITATVVLQDVAETPVYADREVALNVTQGFYGLSTNDVNQIPGTWSGVTDGSPNYVTLGLAGVSWSVGSVDEFGMPKTYNAVAVYRGVDIYSTLDHYDVVATYAYDAAVPTGEREFSVVATYEEKAPDAPVVPWEVVAGVAAAAAAVIGVVGWRRRRARVIASDGDTERVLLRVPVKTTNEGYSVHIPDGVVTPSNNETIWLEMPARCVKQKRPLEVFWMGVCVYRAATFARVRIGQATPKN